MKRIGLIVIAILLVAFPMFPQTVNIPDANFLNALIALGVDANGDKIISNVEAEAVSLLNVSEKRISDMTSIEAFVNLDTLDCRNNLYSSIDVSIMPGLINLDCSGNQLTCLDVSKNDCSI